MHKVSNHKVTAIIFDWAGVFCNPGEPFSHPDLTNILNLTVDEIGEKVKDIQYEYYKGKIDSENFWEQIINFFKLENLTGRELSQSYLSSYNIYPEMLLLAAILKEKYKTILLSNLTEEMMNDILKKYDIKKYFQKTIFSNEVGLMKPDPAIYKLASETLGVPAKETIFIDDSKTNVKAAEVLGFKTILFNNYKQLISDLNAFGVILEK